jgi:hypothetical protein
MMFGFWRPNSRNFSEKKFLADLARNSRATLGPTPGGRATPLGLNVTKVGKSCAPICPMTLLQDLVAHPDAYLMPRARE